MTDVMLGKTVIAVGSGTGLVIAVIDPAIASIALALIAAIVTITTLFFTFKTATLNKLAEQDRKLITHDVKIEEVIKTSDGMKDALVKSTAIASRAEGLMAGIAQAENKAAIVTTARSEGKATGIAQEKEAEANRQMTPPGNFVK